MAKEWLTSAETQQLDITARDAVPLPRGIQAATEEENALRQKFEDATSKRDPATERTIKKATVGVLYTRPVKRLIFTANGCPPWFERLRRDLQKDSSTYLQPLQSISRLTRQRPDRFEEDRLQSKNYARDPIKLLPMGKDLLQKTRIAFLVDSTMKSSYNANNTLIDLIVMNMPCTFLSEMAEVTDKMFTPAAAETIPLLPFLVYSNIIDHLALRGTLRYFELGPALIHRRLRNGLCCCLSGDDVRHRHKDEEQESHYWYCIHVAPRLHVLTKTYTTILVSGARSRICKRPELLLRGTKSEN